MLNPPGLSGEPLNRELNGDQFEKTWGNLFFFVENTVELLKKNYICIIHY